jgi:hypothetical protein
MTQATRHLVLVAIPLFALAAACGGSDGGGASGSGGTPGSGGATGTGGATEGSGGATGTGGATAGSGGATGTGGTVAGTGGTVAGTGGTVVDGGGSDGGGLNPDAPATCGMPTAASPLISDFATGTTAVSMQTNGTTDIWTVSPGGTATIVAGEMRALTTSGIWASASTLVAKTMCVDVSKYAGIKFKIRSATNTALLFTVSTPETEVDFSSFRKQITVTPTSTVVTVPFAELVKPTFGAGMLLPPTYKPETRMKAIGLGVGVMTETLDVYLDDVTFY